MFSFVSRFRSRRLHLDVNSDVLPTLVVECLSHLEEYGLNVEGLFRVSGSHLEIDRLKKAYERGRRRVAQ